MTSAPGIPAVDAQLRRSGGAGRSGVRQRLAEMGQEIFPPDQLTPQALGALQKAEIEKWSPIIKTAGVKAE